MAYLPLANLMHHKLRSTLSALGIGMGICMLITLSGLARGSLFEVADRWEAVDADLTMYSYTQGENAGFPRGPGLSEGIADKIRTTHGEEVERVVPVFLWLVKMGGQDQMAAGVDPEMWHTLTGGREIKGDGRLFDRDNRFAKWLVAEVTAPAPPDAPPLDLTQDDLSHPDHNGLEMVIDTRLARAGGYKLNQVVEVANHDWTIVGIVPAGAMTRVFLPRRTAQYLFGDGNIKSNTLMFIKLKEGVDPAAMAEKLKKTTGQTVVPIEAQRKMLVEKFGRLFVYVDMANGIALTMVFLFVMTTLYTMVLQQTREIAILKANGAGNWFVIRQVLGESLLLTVAGAVVGIAVSVPAAWVIERFQPLLTVTIMWQWIVIAIGSALVGATISAIYPAWQATRVDIVEALTLE